LWMSQRIRVPVSRISSASAKLDLPLPLRPSTRVSPRGGDFYLATSGDRKLAVDTARSERRWPRRHRRENRRAGSAWDRSSEEAGLSASEPMRPRSTLPIPVSLGSSRVTGQRPGAASIATHHRARDTVQDFQGASGRDVGIDELALVMLKVNGAQVMCAYFYMRIQPLSLSATHTLTASVAVHRA
jgi:hypothetical protein